MKRRLGKQIISLVLVFCTLLSLLPVSALATQAESTETESSVPFSDVAQDAWYYDSVMYAYVNGLVNGTSDTTFDPQGGMTRGMFVTVLGRMAGVNTENYLGQSVYSDVAADKYYAPYVAWASKHGITTGTGDGIFSPDALINRQQLATFFVRYCEAFDVEYGEDTVTTQPADIDEVADWAKDAVLTLWSKGILNGDGTNFNPTDEATRAEAVTLSTRMDAAVETWYSEPGVESDRVRIDPTTGEAFESESSETPTTPVSPVVPSWPSGGSGNGTTTTTYYEVAFTMGSGQDTNGVTMPETKTYPENTKISLLPTPFKHNGMFLGWYTDAAMENPVAENAVLTRNITLYAKMGEVTPVSEQETPNYVTVVVPAAQVASYSFKVNNYSADSVEYFTHISNLNAEMVYSVSGTKITAAYEEGQTYSFKLQDDSAATLVVNGVEQPAAIRVLNIITEKGEVQNLELDGDVKLLPAASVTNMTGTALDGLFNISISGQSGEGSISQNKNIGTFTYAAGGIDVGDIVAIYEGTRPDLRDANSQNEAVAYVKITSISGNTYSYETAETEEVLFTPDVLPVTSQVAANAVMTLDGETETYNVTVYQDDMQFTDDEYAVLGLDSQTTIDVGDFIAFYSGDFGVSATSDGYGCITAIREGEYEGQKTYEITYSIATIDEVMASMDIYGTRNEEIEITEERKRQIEDEIKAQAIESGFVEAAAEYLTALAIETDGFQELSDDLDMDLSSYSITFADGTPVDPDSMDLMAVKAEITESSVVPQLIIGDLTHFEGSKGVRVELVMNFKVEIGSGENKLEIVLEAIFEEEILLDVNVSGGAVWKWAWIFPYIADYQMNANFDLGTFTGIGITATAQTVGADEEEEGFDWNMSTGNTAGDKIISIGSQIKELMDKKNEFMDQFTIPTVGLTGNDENFSEDVESNGSITSGGLAEKYSAFMENAEESWIEILRVEIFSSEGNVDPLHILCYGISADFVVSANLYVTIGMTFEYGVAKRYNFSLSLYGKSATNEVIDLEEAHYQFDFYVMGTMGIRAGIEFEVAVGLFSLKLDSIGICAEAGAYAQMWGYFYYSLSWTKSEGKSSYCAGAMAIEIGMYLSISFKAQLFSSDKLTYQPTIYENEWPLLTIGDVENVYDFAYAEDDDILSMTVKSAEEFELTSDLFNMNYMDMKSGDLYGSDSDEDEDGEPDNEPGNFDDETESRYTIELSNSKFHYNPDGNIITVDPGSSIEETCEVRIIWKHGTLTFSSQAIERTLTINWSNPDEARYISFNSKGGSAVEMITGKSGVSIAVPAAPSKVGYDFGGWYKNSSCTQAFNFPSTMPDYKAETGNKGITVYAKWIPRDDTKYTVEHYQQQLNGTYVLVDTDNKTGTTDANTAAAAKTYTGFTVKSFSQKKISPNGSTVVKLYYTRDTYTVSFTYGTFAGSNEPLTYTAKYGATIYAPNMALGGYEFVEFTGLTTDANGGLKVTGNATYAAVWTPSQDTPYRVEHYIQRTSGSGYLLAGDNAIQSLTGETDSIITLSEFGQLSDAGLTYIKATANGADITASAPARIAADGTTVVKLYYDRKSFDLVLMNGETQISSTPTVYGCVLQMPTAPEKQGYDFGGWYTDAACSEGSEFSFGTATMPSNALTLYVKWVAKGDIPYTVEHWQQNVTGDEYTKADTENLTGTTGADTVAQAKDYSADGFKAANTFEQVKIAADGSTVVKIYYDRNTYDVTFNSNGGSDVAKIEGVRHGATVAEPADPEKEGYTFGGWYLDAGFAQTFDFSTAITDDITLYAKWTANTYKVTLDADGGDCDKAEITVTYDGIYDLPTPTRTGYTFDAWYLDGTKIVNGSQVKITADATLKAEWIIGGNSIVYTLNGGNWSNGTNAPTSFNVETETFSLLTPVKTGYTFTGWTGTGLSEATETVTIAKGSIGNREYTANWQINQYTITFNTDGGTAIDAITQDYGTAVTKPADPTKTGYTFKAWSETIPGTMPAENMEITAQWTANTYKVTLNANGGECDKTEITVTYDGTYDLPTPEKTGYTFGGWYLGESKIANGDTVKITAAATLKAEWIIGGSSISYTLNGGNWSSGTNAPTSFNVETETFSLPTPVKTGYTFLGWTGSNGETPAQTVTIAKGSTGNREYTANWQINQYTITFVDSDGTTELHKITQDYGTAVTEPTKPTRVGYTFGGWSEAIPTAMPAENMTVKASWTANTYKVTLNANGGECDKTEITVTYDGTYELPTPTRTGYTFDAWYLDGSKIVNGSQVKITADATLKAEWILGGNTITYELDGGNWTQGTDVPTNFNVESDAITLPTPVKTGYTFLGWTGTGLTEATKTVTIAKGSTGNREYTANWQINQYTITFNTDGGTAIDAITQNYGTAVTKPADPTKEGYTFKGWDAEIPATMPADNMEITASWQINQYTITFNTDGGTAIDAITQDYGTAITKPANPTKEGYTFIGWSTEIPANMPAGNLTITAQWGINQYTITWLLNGEKYDSQTADYGTAVKSVADPTQTGYTFSGWSDSYSTIPAKNVTVVGTLAINKYTVKWENGGETVKTATEDFGTEVTMPTVDERTGYTFKGWQIEGDDKLYATGETYTIAAANVTFVAKWQINTYNLTINLNGGTAVEVPETYTVESDDIVLPTPVKTGYTFLGWTGTNLTEATKTVTIPEGSTGDRAYVATWEATKCTVTWVSDGFANNVYHEITDIAYGTAIGAPAEPTREGYTFTGWDKDIPDTITSDLTITASWTVNTYNLTVDLDDGTAAEVPTTYTVESDDIVLPTPVKIGYTFTGWTGTGLSEATKTVTIAKGSTGNREYNANWQINQYTITFDTAGGTDIDAITQDYGTAVTKPADPTKEGYTFKGWDAEIPGTMPAENMEITAQWTANTYTVSFDLNGVDGETPESKTVTFDSTYGDLPAIESRPGYTFLGWYTASTGGSKVDSTTKVSIGSDHTLYAQWTVHQYTITFQNTGDSTIATITGSYGTAVTKPADPERAGYTFTGWDKTIPDTLTESLTITAQWEIVNYTINYANMDGATNGEGNPATYTVETETFQLNRATKTGYTFAGWYDAAEGGNQVTSVAKGTTGNLTLYARWEEITYTVQFVGVLNGINTQLATVNGVKSGTAVTYPEEEIAAKAQELDCFVINTWYIDVTCTEVFDLATGITAPTTLYAKCATTTVTTGDALKLALEHAPTDGTPWVITVAGNVGLESNITIPAGANVTIKGADSSEQYLLTTSKQISAKGVTLKVENLKIEGGTTNLIFYASEGTDLTVKNCNFIGGNGAISGGYMGAAVKIENCDFTEFNTTAWNQGYVLYFSNTDPGTSVNVTITNCEFYKNTGSHVIGAGYYVLVTMTGCNMKSNETQYGCVDSQFGGQLVMDSCVLENNVVTDEHGGIVYLNDGSSATLNSCTLSQNSAAKENGAVYVENNCSATLNNCTLSQNSATSKGGAVYIGSNGSVILNGCTLSGNTDTGNTDYEGVYNNGGTLTVK